MRIFLKTCPNKEMIPFNYQQKLVGCIHKWLGQNNDEHGNLSLYSFSWLKGSESVKGGLNFKNGATWFISFHDETKIKLIIQTILDEPEMFCGMSITEITIQENLDLSKRELFSYASPIFLKRQIEGQNQIKHYSFNDKEANQIMKETIIHKMEVAGLPADETFDIKFDLSYVNKRTKLVVYDNIKNKANQCPIIITGKPETKAFIWNVGVGNCTGIGMGAII